LYWLTRKEKCEMEKEYKCSSKVTFREDDKMRIQQEAAVEIKKLQQQVADLEARCKKLRECMEQAASMPGRDWLGGQMALATVLLEDDAVKGKFVG
jgi:hypothetical protein